LIKNQYRKNTSPGTDYKESLDNDIRFTYNIGTIQSIAASNSQNDSGMFELSFRDERYLPFEGTGAVSSWKLELPTKLRQFDYNTISDVIIHVKYTAREGGTSFKTLANDELTNQIKVIKQRLDEKGLHVAINIKHDLPNEWQLLKNNASMDLLIDKTRLPYMAQPFNPEIKSVMFIAKVEDNPANFVITVRQGNNAAIATNLSINDDLKLWIGINDKIKIGTSFNLSIVDADKEKLEELMMVVKYEFET